MQKPMYEIEDEDRMFLTTAMQT